MVESYDDEAGDLVAVDRAVTTVIGDVLALAGELAEHLREPGRGPGPDRPGAGPPRRPAAGGGAAVQGAAQGGERAAGALESRATLLPLVERYAAYKRSRGAMDYGDQVAIAARIARDHPEVAEIERGRFAAVLLDEYQDTGEAQRVLLTSLFGRGHAVTAVGDPRQSIYGWRGASAGNLERFGDDFAGDEPTGSSGLTTSFRNGEGILGVANVVAGGIPVRGALAARSTRRCVPGPAARAPGEAVVALLDSVADEAEWVADQVHALGDAATSRLGTAVPWGQVAVLARKRSHFARLEAALRARGVPCEVVGLGGLLTRPEVVDVVSTLRVLADPGAGGALLRLLTGPRWRHRAARPRRARPPRATHRGVDRPASTWVATADRTPTSPTTTWSTSGAWSTRSTTWARRVPTPSPATSGWSGCATSCAGCGGGRRRRCPTW